jgi:hypothetical protein
MIGAGIDKRTISLEIVIFIEDGQLPMVQIN